MAMYALGVIPVTKVSSCRQVWYADDATGCDTLLVLLEWFNLLKKHGPLYGYHPKPEKCILLVKPERLERAREVFLGTGVQVETEGSKDVKKVDKNLEIISEGARHLGAAVGTSEFKRMYVKKKVGSWVQAVEKISQIAATQPTRCISVTVGRRLIYLLRVHVERVSM